MIRLFVIFRFSFDVQKIRQVKTLFVSSEFFLLRLLTSGLAKSSSFDTIFIDSHPLLLAVFNDGLIIIKSSLFNMSK